MFVKAGIFTVKLSLYGILLSLVIGIFCTLVKFYKVKILTSFINGYIEVSRNTPLLIQLFFLYYGLSKFGLNLSAFTCVVVGLAFLGGSYITEIECLKDGFLYKDGEKTFWICTNCGHIHFGDKAPEKCPVCDHPQGYFERRVISY